MTHLLDTYGYLVVFAAPLLESMGVPFPGEAALLAGSVYAGTTGRLSILLVVLAAAAGAILGDNLGYLVGRIGGRALLLGPGRYVGFTPRRLDLLERFFRRRGPAAVFLARFITVVRNLAALAAGAACMRYRRFLLFNVVGACVWAGLYGSLADVFGRSAERSLAKVATLGLAAAGIGILALTIALVLGHRQIEQRLERWLVGPEPTADAVPPSPTVR
ncbi:MAG TPA: DedA family protein [Verrucomicrobiae bacterium]|nr:DedA family protein [Verrucomicrobiae bacterium]